MSRNNHNLTRPTRRQKEVIEALRQLPHMHRNGAYHYAVQQAHGQDDLKIQKGVKK